MVLLAAVGWGCLGVGARKAQEVPGGISGGLSGVFGAVPLTECGIRIVYNIRRGGSSFHSIKLFNTALNMSG